MARTVLAFPTFVFRLVPRISLLLVTSFFRFLEIAAVILYAGIAYTFDDVSGDTSLNHFDITKAPSYVFSAINDVQAVNPYLKVHLLPWSPVGFIFDFGRRQS